MPAGIYQRHPKPVQSRFEEKIERIPECGCWIWMGAVNRKGYGRILVNNINKLAARVSYELYIGPIPENMCVCHTCDTPSCVNPNHLFLGTNNDNVKDKMKKNRQAKGENHSRAKLTEELVVAIRDDNRSLPKIAKIYGMSTSSIYGIKHRIYWKHI